MPQPQRVPNGTHLALGHFRMLTIKIVKKLLSTFRFHLESWKFPIRNRVTLLQDLLKQVREGKKMSGFHHSWGHQGLVHVYLDVSTPGTSSYLKVLCWVTIRMAHKATACHFLPPEAYLSICDPCTTYRKPGLALEVGSRKENAPLYRDHLGKVLQMGCQLTESFVALSGLINSSLEVLLSLVWQIH